MIVIKYFCALVARTRRRGEKIDFSDLPLSKLLSELE